jgi:hypothetical protein
MRALSALVFACAACAATGAQAAAYHLIICGSGGEEEFSNRFENWGQRLKGVLEEFDSQNTVFLLTEKARKESHNAATSLESIERAIADVAAFITPEDDFFLYLIGHGSFIRRESRFLIPGPDLTAEGLGEMLAPINARCEVIINAASSSAGYINVLSAPDRIICTATRSTDEFNATEFMEHFLEGLEDGSADRDHDGRISVLEACGLGAELTEAWYVGQGLLATEHALLDDNGDGLGSRLPLQTAPGTVIDDANDGQAAVFDGARAAECYLKNFSFPDHVPRDLIDAYLAAIEKVEALKKEKATLDETDYYARLESHLLEAARANREIHRLIDEAS